MYTYRVDASIQKAILLNIHLWDASTRARAYRWKPRLKRYSRPVLYNSFTRVTFPCIYLLRAKLYDTRYFSRGIYNDPSWVSFE